MKRCRIRCARILLIAGAAGSVMVGLVPEDENLNLHVLAAFVAIVTRTRVIMSASAGQHRGQIRH